MRVTRSSRGTPRFLRTAAVAAATLAVALVSHRATPRAQSASGETELMPGGRVILWAGPPGPPSLVTSAHTELIRGGYLVPERATIVVRYTGFGSHMVTAFQFAVSIWATQLTSSVPIEVSATWTDLCRKYSLPQGCGILGTGGPRTFVRDPGLPFSDTWYTVALGNALAGRDLATPYDDISVEINSDWPSWYFGTDGNPPTDQIDFATVVLHELGHGLGFLGLAGYANGTGTVGFGDGRPTIWERFVVNGAGTSILSFTSPSTALGAQLTGNNLYWNGPNGISANGGSRPKLYAPAAWSGGSSYSHLDESTYPPGNASSLMTPQTDQGEAIQDPGPVTRGILKDMGWAISASTPPTPAPTLSGVSPNSGPTTGGNTVTLTGTNFIAFATTVAFGSLAGGSANVTSSTSLTVVVPPQAAGPVNVSVTTAGGTATLTSGYTYIGPAPTITSFAPASVRGGTGAFTLRVFGTNFVSGAVVRWNGSARTTVFVSATELRASILAADTAGGASTPTVSVRNPDGQIASRSYTVTTSWRMCGAGDLNKDGFADLVWQSANGYIAVWLMNGVNQASSLLLYNYAVAVEGWNCVAVGDLNGDGFADLIWQNTSGYVAGWIMNGTTQVSNSLLYDYPVAVGGWNIVAAGDLDGDRKADLLWQDGAGYVAVWFMDGLTQRYNTLLDPRPVAAGGWQIVGTGDLSKDGYTDLVWQSSDGYVAAWLMVGATQVSNLLLYNYPVAVGGWNIDAVGDLNNDGSADLVWLNDNGSLAAWLMNGTTQAVNSPLNPNRVF